MRIIPAIDIIDGKCVRLTKGVYSSKKVYSQSPVDVAMQLQDAGIKHLHLVDLDGAKNGEIVNYRVLESIASNTNLSIDFGGGVRNEAQLKIAFNSGAKQVNVGSIAVKNRNLTISWLEAFGSDKIILGADARNGKITIDAWKSNFQMDVVGFISNYEKVGMKYCVCTDISKDGMMSGPSLKLYENVLCKTNINLIASGGVTSIADLQTLQTIGCEGAIIGKALYEGAITLKQLQEFC